MSGRPALCTLFLLLPTVPQQPPRPAWARFAGIEIGASIDDLVSGGAVCHSVGATLLDVPQARPDLLAPEMFGYSLPHAHGRADTAAVRAALASGTVCLERLLDGQAGAMILAYERVAVAAVVYFGVDSTQRPPRDSVRALVWRRWSPPTHAHPNLDTWRGPRYRGYLVMPAAGSPGRYYPMRLLLVDARACTSFDRRVHRASRRGSAEAC